MPRLSWAAIGERYFESGVDRGVLYVSGDGYAWPGLVSVDESPSGGGPRPFYHDGIKYLNLAAAEEFEATISAFSSPPEFGPCDGRSVVYNGLFATQQPRKPFDFSYRTKIGNDTEGLDHGYKIHLVYNALAAPAGRSSQTLSESPNISALSWKITTLAPLVTGLRPTSHFVIDSRFAPDDILEQIENKLYGDDNFDPTFPTVAELMDIFGG